MQNIILKTAQNVAIEYELASLRERVTAFMIDLLVVLLGYVLLVILIANAVSNQQSINNMAIYVVYSVLPIACFFIVSTDFRNCARRSIMGQKSHSY